MIYIFKSTFTLKSGIKLSIPGLEKAVCESNELTDTEIEDVKKEIIKFLNKLGLVVEVSLEQTIK